MKLGLLQLCYLFIFCLAIQSADINHVRTKLLVRDTVDDNSDEKEGQPEGADDGDDNGKAKVSSYTFRGKIKKYIYMKKPIDSDATDETLLALTSQNEVFVTHDQGSTWEEVAPDDEFLAIHLNPFDTNNVYFKVPMIRLSIPWTGLITGNRLELHAAQFRVLVPLFSIQLESPI